MIVFQRLQGGFSGRGGGAQAGKQEGEAGPEQVHGGGWKAQHGAPWPGCKSAALPILGGGLTMLDLAPDGVGGKLCHSSVICRQQLIFFDLAV
jgi:hypothetical protein